MRTFYKDKLLVKIADSRAEMGAEAGANIANKIRELQAAKDELNIIFAAAPSQNETLATLLAADGIDWSRINAFHMDEYVGLPDGDARRFGNFLKEAIFGKKPFKSVNYINGNAADIDAECQRYTDLLAAHPIDLVCLGIGENGHIAFNDPPVADFNDPYVIKRVKLDEICRQQQVNDGCFKTIDDVPKTAITLTIPAIMSAKTLVCTVPAATKANATKEACLGPVSEACPASIIRTHDDCVLFCDPDSGRYLV